MSVKPAPRHGGFNEIFDRLERLEAQVKALDERLTQLGREHGQELGLDD